MSEISKTDVLNFLRNNPIMNLAAVTGEQPISSVVLFTVTDDFVFHFCTHSESIKAQALIHNHKLSFSVWKIDDLYVQATGQATLITPAASKEIYDTILASTNKVEGFWPPIFQMPKDKYSIFSIHLDKLRALDLKVKTITRKGDPFVNFDL